MDMMKTFGGHEDYMNHTGLIGHRGENPNAPGFEGYDNEDTPPLGHMGENPNYPGFEGGDQTPTLGHIGENPMAPGFDGETEFTPENVDYNQTQQEPPIDGMYPPAPHQHDKKHHDHDHHDHDHKGHHGMWGMKSVDTDNMTCEQTCDLAKQIIGCAVIAIFVYGTICTMLSQWMYICVINKIKSHQERLERHFMGDQ
jgi:hypothetical protein